MTRDDIHRYIVQASLDGADESSILAGTCARLIEAGVPVVRATLASDMLDPTYDSYGVRWSRDEGVIHESYERNPTPQNERDWLASPFYRMVTGEADRVRRHGSRSTSRPTRGSRCSRWVGSAVTAAAFTGRSRGSTSTRWGRSVPRTAAAVRWN